jgi:group I intron endonuclease
MEISGIYQIQSRIKPEKIYIGSAINMYKRWGEHINSLRRQKHKNLKLQVHYNKYGESDLQFSILLGCKKEELIRNEQSFIDALNPYFNICKIAGSTMGVIPSIDTRKKQSRAKKGKPSPKKGIPINESQKQKLRDFYKINPFPCPRKGKKANDKTIINLRISHTGKKQSLETIEKRVSKIRKKIIQFNENNSIIKEWDSISETRNAGFEPSSVGRCCNGIAKSTGGFKWKYKNIA